MIRNFINKHMKLLKMGDDEYLGIVEHHPSILLHVWTNSWMLHRYLHEKHLQSDDVTPVIIDPIDLVD